MRYYASGRPLTHRAHLLLRQAEMVSNQRLHLRVVRKMYQLRFPDDDTSGLTTQQLRGREGSRVRRAYKEAAKKMGRGLERQKSQYQSRLKLLRKNQKIFQARLDAEYVMK